MSQMFHAVLVGTSGTVSLNANPGQLPGGATLQQLTNGIGGWALILALVALVVGAAVWALSQLMGREEFAALASEAVRTESDPTVRGEWQVEDVANGAAHP